MNKTNEEKCKRIHVTGEIEMHWFQKGRSSFRAEVEKVLLKELKEAKRLQKAIPTDTKVAGNYCRLMLVDIAKKLNLNLTEKGKRVGE